MHEEMKSATLESKSEFKLPEGAVVIKKSHSITVEEIENGFIIRKSYDIKYTLGDESGYEYFTKKWFSKKNPIQLDKAVMKEEKTLADNFKNTDY